MITISQLSSVIGAILSARDYTCVGGTLAATGPREANTGAV